MSSQSALRLTETDIVQTSDQELERILSLIGKKVREARKERRYTQLALAEIAGLDRGYLSMIENGKQNLSLAALVKLARALEVSLTQLLPEE